jgi:hydroxymethylbilane synthase|tara:strand:+ start:1769 stop:2704 length:936 start_codon:yes stop_codon:yes gene_type:complete
MTSETAMKHTIIRIGTRGSPLALKQATEVRDQLIEAHSLKVENFEIVIIKTTGDRIVDRPLSSLGGKGLFTKEIEEALAEKKIDIAVHSMKDMPTKQPDNLVIDCFLKREDPRDAFISNKLEKLSQLDQTTVVGTSSLRRKAQILNLMPSVKVVEFRGNVQTRLKKLDDGVADCTFLAMAGLKRLGLNKLINKPIAIGTMLPAVAQGIIGVERRAEDKSIESMLKKINNKQTMQMVNAERTMLKILDGSCETPIAGLAIINKNKMTLKAEVLRVDGTEKIYYEATDNISNAINLGQEVGEHLKSKIGKDYY